jgi:hypothetical protein
MQYSMNHKTIKFAMSMVCVHFLTIMKLQRETTTQAFCVYMRAKSLTRTRLMHSVSLASVAAECHNNKSKLHRRCHALLFSNFHLAQFLAFPLRESWYGGRRPLVGGTLVFYFFPAKSCARRRTRKRPLGVIIGSFQLQHLFSPLRVLIKSQRTSPCSPLSLKSTPLDRARLGPRRPFLRPPPVLGKTQLSTLFCSFVPQKFMRRHCTHAHPLKLFHPPLRRSCDHNLS